MPAPKKLVLFVEGEGDRKAAPILVKKVLTELNAWDVVALDRALPWQVGDLGAITKEDGRHWVRFLRAASKQSNLGGVLLLLDGDAKSIRREPFCAARFASRLAEESRAAGGGSQFSVACVFARQEFESWFVACADRLAGQRLSDGREGLAIDTASPPIEPDIEAEHIRDAKKWLSQRMAGGYKETRDQGLLAEQAIAHFDAIRARPMKSFLRFERAVGELVLAIRSERHTVSPVWPKPSSGVSTQFVSRRRLESTTEAEIEP